MKLSIVSAHTMDFYHFFKLQHAMMQTYDPDISITVARSNTVEQFGDSVNWIDLEYPDYLHESHRNYTMMFNLMRGPLAKMADGDRVAWMDADILPLEHGAVTEFMTASDSPTVAHNVHMGEEIYSQWNSLTEWFGVGGIPCYNCGFVAANKTDTFWDEWADTKKMLYTNRLDQFLTDTGTIHYGVPVRMFFIDQIALNYIISQNPKRFHYVDSSYNWQPLDPNGDIWTQTVRMPLGTKILHLSGPSKKSMLIDMETINV